MIVMVIMISIKQPRISRRVLATGLNKCNRGNDPKVQLNSGQYLPQSNMGDTVGLNPIVSEAEEMPSILNVCKRL
jgi:hypothetical protein